MKFTLKPKQIEYIFATEQFPAFVAAVGTTKTTCLIERGMVLSQAPRNLGVIVRKNFVDLRDSTMRDFELYTGFDIPGDTKEVTLKNGSVIMFRHGDELPVLKNLNLGWFGIEQAEEFGDSTPWDMLCMRLRRQVPFRSGFLIANANGHNWIWDKWIKNGPQENHRTIQATTYDFKDILPQDYISNLEKNLPKRLFQRYVLNSHEVSEGRVYDEYSETPEAEILIDPFEIPDSWEKGFCLDHGYRNPTGVLWYAIDYDGNLILYDEHYQAERPISYHAESIKTRNIFQGIADPSIFSRTQSDKSGFHTIADEYRELGITLYPALREEEYAAIARVNEFFKAKRIKVFKTLVNARHEFANWRWQPVRPGLDPRNFPEVPEDYRNHLCLSGDTLIHTRNGLIPINSMKDNIFDVWTPFGWKSAFCLETGCQKTITLKFNDGSVITGSHSHPLLSSLGWDTMEYINEGDVLYGTSDYQRYNPRISRQALLLGRFSLLPKSGENRKWETQDALASQSGMDKQFRRNKFRNASTSPEPQSERQLFSESLPHDYERTFETPFDVGGKETAFKTLYKESYSCRPKMASFQIRKGMAQETWKTFERDLGEKSLLNSRMPFLQETIQVERQPQFYNSFLRSELQNEVLPQKRVVQRWETESQLCFNLEVEDSRSFFLSNGIISHNCDDLKYLIQTRFPSSRKPDPAPEVRSLNWHFENQKFRQGPRVLDPLENVRRVV